MNQSDGEALGAILDRMTTETLSHALRRNADLPRAHKLARKIMDAHRLGRLGDTGQLARVAGIPRPHKGHPAASLFLALRMMVNEELEEVEKGFPVALEKLCAGGKLVAITFHSTEDRTVKRVFRRWAGRCGCDAIPCLCPRVARVRLVTPKPVAASREEQQRNPRSRSAKLRCVEFLGL